MFTFATRKSWAPFVCSMLQHTQRVFLDFRATVFMSCSAHAKLIYAHYRAYKPKHIRYLVASWDIYRHLEHNHFQCDDSLIPTKGISFRFIIRCYFSAENQRRNLVWLTKTKETLKVYICSGTKVLSNMIVISDAIKLFLKEKFFYE